jgi:ribosomal protein L18
VYKNKLNHNPFTAKIFEHVKNKQNIIVNNLSNDNKKQFGKRLGKITHNHALQVMYWIARRLLKEDYEAVVP